MHCHENGLSRMSSPSLIIGSVRPWSRLRSLRSYNCPLLSYTSHPLFHPTSSMERPDRSRHWTRRRWRDFQKESRIECMAMSRKGFHLIIPARDTTWGLAGQRMGFHHLSYSFLHHFSASAFHFECQLFCINSL